jgi:hypothetical protein
MKMKTEGKRKAKLQSARREICVKKLCGYQKLDLSVLLKRPYMEYRAVYSDPTDCYQSFRETNRLWLYV